MAAESSGNSSSPSSFSSRNNKRKLDDALDALDRAARPYSDTSDNPSPSKKPHISTPRSIYSTLTKYGIKTKDRPSVTSTKFDTISKLAPHLAAIIARTSRKAHALPVIFKHPSLSASPSMPDYRPSSTSSFLSRLSTFKLATYANKPPQIDAVAASRCGWTHGDGKDRLVCGICGVSWVVVGRENMTRDAANTLVEKQRSSLVDMHKDGCPWKTRQCDPSIYRIPLQSSAGLVREIKSRAVQLDPFVTNIEIKHPLTSAQVRSVFIKVMAASVPPLEPPSSSPSLSPVPNLAVEVSSVSVPSSNPESNSTMATGSQAEPSETAILTALFGWAPAPPPPQELSRRRSSSSSLPPSRGASIVPRSRQSTPAPHLQTPASSPDRPSSLRHSSTLARSSTPLPQTDIHKKSDTALLHCSLCQRRIGLWAFAPPSTVSDSPSGQPQKQRQLDILKEHRSYCPYVVRSTIVPSLPLLSSNTSSTVRTTGSGTASGTDSLNEDGAVEGWRAVLTVVLRYVIRRPKVTPKVINSNPLGDAEAREAMEVDGVEAMVLGVKARGGKELLKYVKGLLG